MTSAGQTTSVVVRQVTIEDGGACPEALTYRMAFANDWAEGLGLKLSEAIAADALLPQTALNVTGQCACEPAAVASGERDGDRAAGGCWNGSACRRWV